MIFRGNLNYHHHLNYTRNSRVEPPIPSFATAIPKTRRLRGVGGKEEWGKANDHRMSLSAPRRRFPGNFVRKKKSDGNLFGGPLKGKSKNEEMQPSRNFWWYILDSHFWVGKEHCSTGTNTFFFWGGQHPRRFGWIWVGKSNGATLWRNLRRSGWKNVIYLSRQSG